MTLRQVLPVLLGLGLALLPPTGCGNSGGGGGGQDATCMYTGPVDSFAELIKKAQCAPAGSAQQLSFQEEIISFRKVWDGNGVPSAALSTTCTKCFSSDPKLDELTALSDAVNRAPSGGPGSAHATAVANFAAGVAKKFACMGVKIPDNCPPQS